DTSASSSAASSRRPTFPGYSTWGWPASSGRGRRWMTSSRSFVRGRRRPGTPTRLRPPMLDDLLQQFRQGDRLALSRLLSLAARGESIPQLTSALGSVAKRARVVALTGSGGVGKSTLIGKLIEKLRSQGKSVAVLACDPQSP